MEPPVTPRPEWNTGKGDHDVPFRFGKHPLTYLHVREFARLLVLRARLGDQSPLRDRFLKQPEATNHVHPQSQPRDGAEAPGPESSGDSAAG